MIKIENKRLAFIAVILTIVFIAVTLSTLMFNSQSAKDIKYIGIKPNGQMVTLHKKVEE
jgi:uncharacterized protein YpmB